MLLCIYGPAIASPTSVASSGKDSDVELIERTLTDYMEGTANGEPDKLRRAFHPDFKLYAVDDMGKLLVRSGEQYIANVRTGEKTDRVGRIVSIDVENNAASAKVDIVVSKSRRYSDYFLLLKYEGSWKIVQKSYTWVDIPKNSRRILFVTSNQHTYGTTALNAANHFAEIAIAYDAYTKSGYVVDFVSPAGGAIPLGYVETSDPIQKKYLYDAAFMRLLSKTRSPEHINPGDYGAVYYSGGGSAMFGVADNVAIQRIAETIYRNGGVISAVCHGTAGIVNLKSASGTSLLTNKKITGFPDLFEDVTAEYYKTFPFSIGKEVAKQGGKFIYSKTWGDDFHLVDDAIVTGQDPSSTASVARKVIELLQKKPSANNA